MLQVGPHRAIKTIAAAAQQSQDGDTIEVDGGTYYGDVTYWVRHNVTLRGVNGRAVVDANGRNAGGKGIFVVSGYNFRIENFELRNARVPDLNGAGIRMETDKLVVVNTIFRNNENGILTHQVAHASLEVHDSEFIDNGKSHSNGQAHGIYVGQIGRFVVRGSWFTGTQVGHLIKSRARESHIVYNRITNEAGSSSYEINLPNGGVAYVIGNLIQQGAHEGNSTIVSYGEEGVPYAANQIYLINNTIVNRKAGWCTWLRAPNGGTVRAVNNALLGNCGWALRDGGELRNNPAVYDGDFINAASFDFRLRGGAAMNSATDPGWANGIYLKPTHQYVWPTGQTPVNGPHSGAFQ